MDLSSYETTENPILFSVMNMDMKSGEGLWIEEYYRIALEFIEGVIDESEWKSYHDTQNSKHHFEILKLKKNYCEFAEFIRLLSLENRRRILMDVYSTGYTREQFVKAGVSSKRVGKFVNMENKKDEEISCNFLTILSLYCRVPLHWLMVNYVTDIWDNEHLLLMPEIPLHKFYDYLEEASKASRAVNGLRVTSGLNTYRVRVEILSGAFLVEFYHESLSDLEFTTFKDSLHRFHCIPGYMRTVITERTHRAILGYKLEQGISITPPIEFYTNDSKTLHAGK